MRLAGTLLVAWVASVLALAAPAAADDGDAEEEAPPEEERPPPACIEHEEEARLRVNVGVCIQNVRSAVRDAQDCGFYYQPQPGPGSQSESQPNSLRPRTIC